MVWDGEPFAHYVEFGSGAPTGPLSYALRGNAGNVIDSGSVTVEAGAMGYLLLVQGDRNICNLPLAEGRTLSWNYPTEVGIVADRIVYRVCRDIPLAVSFRGVRSKLGLSDHELDNEDIDLVSAYAEFSTLVGADALTAAVAAGDRSTLLCTDAIEALAALALLPTIQMRAAQRDTSGTNEFARFSSIDWRMLEDRLQVAVMKARQVVDANFDATGANYQTFAVMAPETDAITGS